MTSYPTSGPWVVPNGQHKQRRFVKWHLLCSGPMPGVAYMDNGSEQLRRFVSSLATACHCCIG